MGRNTLRLSEAAFQRQVIELARLCGWRVAHFRPARTARGWRTPVQGDGKGFPDLLLVRGDVLAVAELKADDAWPPEADQATWLAAFARVGVQVFIWRPRHWPEIEAFLQREGS